MGTTGLVSLILFLYGPWIQIASETCSSLTCGWSAQCNQSNCTCPAGLVLQSDGKNCKNASCSQMDCLQCDQPDQCLKCLAFKSKSSGVCLSVCVGSAEQQGDNLVCTEATDDSTKVSVIIAVLAGAGAGVFICLVVLLAACVYLRRTRRNVNLQNKNYTVRQMESGRVKQYSMYDNSGFDPESPAISSTRKIDPLDYVSQLERLRVHIDTLMTLLSQLRAKSKVMDPDDARAPTYKAMIHRMFRVLALLHKKDPMVSIPSDAMSLIHWAFQMLDDFREQQFPPSDFDDNIVVAQISSVDAISPVYMTPESSNMGLPEAPHYSPCPVPLSADKLQHSNTLGRKSGFATISRATSVTNAALLSSIEADEKKFGVFSDTTDGKPASPPSSSGLSREDLQIFLINAPVSNSLVNQPDVISGYNTLPSSGKRNTSDKVARQSFYKESLFTNGSIYADPQKSNSFKPPRQQLSQKKNIITNPKAGSLGRRAGLHYAVSNKGYFANGHYYDPNPMPVLEPEIYAPGSNYSDRSNAMSTFLGDLPRSVSSSDQSDFGDNTSDNSGGDLEVFPFDLKDATEPVEV